ncbi:acyl-CoA thioesterase [Peptococcus simiae]|uniref:acyl-CoA thioesterase n=1 Tax=Peptococcus simiae TaxID=1643805 RepID=UPI00397F46ED
MSIHQNLSSKAYLYQVQPENLNPNHTMHGGHIVTYMDDTAGTCCYDWVLTYGDYGEGFQIFTAAIHDIRFFKAPQPGDLLRFTASIIRTGRSAMDTIIYCEIIPETDPPQLAAIGFMTYVCLRPDGSKARVPALSPRGAAGETLAQLAEKINSHSKALYAKPHPES